VTVKTPKTGTIRRITRAEIDAMCCGGWVDESYPADAVAAALTQVTPEIRTKFLAYLGPRLGRYRVSAEPNMKPSVESRLVEELLDTIGELRIRLKHLPETVRTNIGLVCWRGRHQMFGDFRWRLDTDLKAAWDMVAVAERAIAPGKRASPATRARDLLLHDVVVWFQDHGINGKCHACELARKALDAARVSSLRVPKDSRDIEKAVNRVADVMRENSR
jgi:hypothetical protein